jgi:hypothetical protein
VCATKDKALAPSPQTKAINIFVRALSFISILDRIKIPTPQFGDSVNGFKAALASKHFKVKWLAAKKCMMQMKGIKDKKLNV